MYCPNHVKHGMSWKGQQGRSRLAVTTASSPSIGRRLELRRSTSVKNWKKLIVGIAASAVMASAFTAPSSNAAANSITVAETTPGGVGVQQIPSPWVNSGSISEHVMFRGLLRAKSDLVNVTPDLATSYKVSKDGKSVTFTLKQGVKWSDGTALTPDDVVWSINELLRVAQANAIYVNAFKQIVGASAVSATASTATMSGITVSGNDITINLVAPQASLIPVFAQFMILPKHSLEKEDPLKLATNNFWKAPVVSGPFKVGTFSQGNFITLVPNDNYEGTKPKITSINVVTSANLAADAKAGKLDYFTTNDAQIIKAMQSVSTFKANPINVPYYRYFVFNLTDPNTPFKSVESRQALAYGVDWNSLVTAIYPKLGKVINSGVTSGMPFKDPSVPYYKYDVAKAKALLAAGKFDFSKTVRLRYYYGDQSAITFMTAIAKQLMALGMKVEVLKFQGDATTELYTTRQYDASLKGLSAFNVSEWYSEYSNTATFEKIIGPQPKFTELNAQLSQAGSRRATSDAMLALQKLEAQTVLKFPIHSLQQYLFVSKRITTNNTKWGNPLYIYDNNFANWVVGA